MGPPPISRRSAQGAAPTPATDVYALVVVLYELLTGQLPVQGSTPTEILMRHIAEGVLLRQGAPGMPGQLEAVIAKMTSQEPAERPAMQPLANELRALLAMSRQATTVIAPNTGPAA